MLFLDLTATDSYVGYPGCERQIRDALAGVLGEQKSEFFFDKVRTVTPEASLMLIFSA